MNIRNKIAYSLSIKNYSLNIKDYKPEKAII